MKTTPASPGPPRKRRRLVLIAGAVLAAFLGVCIYFVFLDSDQGLTWLTPQQMADATRPKPFQKLREKLRVIARPLVDWYRGRLNVVVIESKVLNAPVALENDLALGPPSATNAGGMKAWILDPAKMAAFQSQLTNKFAAVIVFAPTFRINDGYHALSRDGQYFPIAVGNLVHLGFEMDLLPKVRHDSINLTVAAASIGLAGTRSTGMSTKTNFYSACRVLIPNAGGVIIRCNSPPDANGSNCWLILRPTILAPSSSGQKSPASPGAAQPGK